MQKESETVNTGDKKKKYTSEEIPYLKLRLIVTVVALLLGATTIAYTVTSAVNKEAGWNDISVTDEETTAALEYTFRYNLQRRGQSISSLHKELQRIYTEATDTAYRLADYAVGYDEINNIYTLNLYPNQEFEVDPALYDFLKAVTESGDYLYLGPVLEEYRSMFSAGSSEEAKNFDPYTDPESAAFVSRVMEFIQNGDISLVFNGNNRVMLKISDAYAIFAEEAEIYYFLDPGILADAFILDYTAEQFIEAGYTEGVLSSQSGFTRVLQDGIEVQINTYSKENNVISYKETKTFTDLSAAVVMKSFPLKENEYWYADLGEGIIRHAYLDWTDGLCKNAVPYFCGTSSYHTCLDLALFMWPIFTADFLEEKDMEQLNQYGIQTIY